MACAGTVEHQEMARYGTLAAWVEALGMTDAAALLRETLAEETETDLLLNGPVTGIGANMALREA